MNKCRGGHETLVCLSVFVFIFIYLFIYFGIGSDLKRLNSKCSFRACDTWYSPFSSFSGLREARATERTAFTAGYK